MQPDYLSREAATAKEAKRRAIKANDLPFRTKTTTRAIIHRRIKSI
ncbi:hypothetical protein [Chromobacterium sp.]